MPKAKKPLAVKKKPNNSRAVERKPLPTPTTHSSTRRLKVPRHQFKFRGRVKPAHPKLPSAFRLFGRALLILEQHWQLFLWLLVIYAVLEFVLVRGLSGGLNLESLKNLLNQGHNTSGLSTSFTLFLYLLGGAGSTNNTAGGSYQTIVLITVSLALIWALRQVHNGAAVRARDAFYRGMYPLVPFLLVLIVIGLQLIPLLLGGAIYSAVISNGIAIGLFEELLWGFLFLVLAALSFFWLCSSLFALYIATLPDMTPMKALRSARDLVRYRRWPIFAKLLFLPLALVVVGTIIMIPIILLITPAAGWIFLLLSIAALAVVHSYMYGLYRELLNE